VAIVLVSQLTQGTAQVTEVEVGILVSTQAQSLGHTGRSAQKDDYRDHAGGLHQLGQIQAIVG